MTSITGKKSRVLTIALALVLALGMAAAVPHQADAAAKKLRRVKKYELYYRADKNAKWTQEGKSDAGVLKYDKKGYLKSQKLNIWDVNQAAAYTYKFRKNGKPQSSKINWNLFGDKFKVTGKYNKKGQCTSMVIHWDEYKETRTYTWKNGYVSKAKTVLTGGVTGSQTVTYSVKTQKGLLKSVTESFSSEDSSYKNTYTFNKKGLVTKAVDTWKDKESGDTGGNTTTYKYAYNKNGTVKHVIIQVKDFAESRKMVFHYYKKKTSKKNYAAAVNSALLETDGIDGVNLFLHSYFYMPCQ